MTLIEAISSALVRLRAEAEGRMTSTCVIDRVTGVETAPDGAVSEQSENICFTKCRIRGRGEWAVERGAGSQQAVHVSEIHIPVNVLGVTVGDRVTVESSPESRLCGNRYRVTRVHETSQTTAQRLGVESWPATLAN